MASDKKHNLDEETVSRLQLQLAEKPNNLQLPSDVRVFEYPGMENVFVMESDLYGNPMPEGSCFLAFQGKHGMLGKHLHIETLRNASAEDIKNMVESNMEG